MHVIIRAEAPLSFPLNGNSEVKFSCRLVTRLLSEIYSAQKVLEM